MKKIMAVLSAMFVLACGMMMTGCDLNEAIESFVGPKDRWCETVFEYEADDETKSDLTCYLYYTESGVTAGTAGYKPEIELLPGLTIIAVADSTNKGASIIAENKYVMKTLKLGEKFNSDGEETSEGKFKMNQLLWTAICTIGDSDIPDTASKIVPTPISSKAAGAEYTKLENPGDFQWKKILAKILIDKLLEEDTE